MNKNVLAFLSMLFFPSVSVANCKASIESMEALGGIGDVEIFTYEDSMLLTANRYPTVIDGAPIDVYLLDAQGVWTGRRDTLTEDGFVGRVVYNGPEWVSSSDCEVGVLWSGADGIERSCLVGDSWTLPLVLTPNTGPHWYPGLQAPGDNYRQFRSLDRSILIGGFYDPILSLVPEDVMAFAFDPRDTNNIVLVLSDGNFIQSMAIDHAGGWSAPSPISVNRNLSHAKYIDANIHPVTGKLVVLESGKLASFDYIRVWTENTNGLLAPIAEYQSLVSLAHFRSVANNAGIIFHFYGVEERDSWILKYFDAPTAPRRIDLKYGEAREVESAVLPDNTPVIFFKKNDKMIVCSE